ncbi:Tautomerase/MIF [Schizophyllum commune Loenen D]|nr:Tautomerase/MIF [Schizophyllum commune Loenen D]
MPVLDLTVNVQIPDAKALSLELSKVGAKILGKPESYISVLIKVNETLTFGGTHDPAFQLVITSLGNVNPAANEKYSKALSEFLKEKLGLSNDRGYMFVLSYAFIDPGNANLGYQGTTFATIFG